MDLFLLPLMGLDVSAYYDSCYDTMLWRMGPWVPPTNLIQTRDGDGMADKIWKNTSKGYLWDVITRQCVTFKLTITLNQRLN